MKLVMVVEVPDVDPRDTDPQEWAENVLCAYAAQTLQATSLLGAEWIDNVALLTELIGPLS